MFAEDEVRLLISAAGTAAELAAMVELRVGGQPLEHVLGWAEFCGLRIMVDRGVFVPRRRTELVVREALGYVRPGAVVVELCCGTGAVSAALVAAEPWLDVHAVDIEPGAVRCAGRNVPIGQVYEGDLYDPLPARLRGRVAILAVNAPYVPTEEIGFMPPEARVYEPRAALDGGTDGLDIQRRVIDGAPSWLAPGGRLFVETSERQAPGTREAIARAGLTPRVVASEELGSTVVIGEMAG